MVPLVVFRHSAVTAVVPLAVFHRTAVLVATAAEALIATLAAHSVARAITEATASSVPVDLMIAVVAIRINKPLHCGRAIAPRAALATQAAVCLARNAAASIQPHDSVTLPVVAAADAAKAASVIHRHVDVDTADAAKRVAAYSANDAPAADGDIADMDTADADTADASSVVC